MDSNSINNRCQKKFVQKVIKYWLQLVEASMASMVLMQVFRNVYFGIQHSKIRVQYMYIPKYDIEYF